MANPVIDEIKQRTDITELVSSRVPLKKTGRTLKGLCPFHEEKTPSFVVYPDQGSYHCFGCGKSGDAFTWLQETEHLDFGEALRRLSQQTGVEIPERRHDPQEAELRQRLTNALSEAATFYHHLLIEARTAEAEAARGYVESRGLTEATVKSFSLGFAPDGWDTLLQHLRERQHDLDVAVEAGLLRESERRKYDLFRGRLIFPIHDFDLSVIGFGARILGEGQPKYLNSPQTPVFDKSKVLYGLAHARTGIRRKDQAVIVEGYMDAVTAHQSGFTNVVATLGTALSEPQVRQLQRYSKNFVLALDADKAGQAATLRGLDVLHDAMTSETAPVPGAHGLVHYEKVIQGEIRVASLPAGHDPDDVLRNDPRQWEQRIRKAKPIVEFAIDAAVAEADLSTAHAKSSVANRIFPLIRPIGDRIARAHYINVLAERLGLDQQTVHNAMASPRRGTEQKRVAAADRLDDIELAITEQRTAASLEEHFLIVLLSLPTTLPSLTYKPDDDDFTHPEFREIYRGVSRLIDSNSTALTKPAAALRKTLDASLWATLERLIHGGASRPPTTSSQRQADLIQAALRLRERTLLDRLRRTQSQVTVVEKWRGEPGEPPPDDISNLLQQQVEVTNALNRVWLALNRPPLYTAAPT